jgi:hypothetical protein
LRLGDRLGVALVVLLRLDVGLDVLRRHQPDLVTLLAQHPAEVMSAAAGLHRHDPGRQPSGKPKDAVSSARAPQ